MSAVLLRVVDLETSGLAAPEAEVIEIGFTDLTFDTETKASIIGKPASLLFSTLRPIQPEASAVHHLTARHVHGLPICNQRDLEMVCASESPAFMVCHNWTFDGQWLAPHLPAGVHPICTMKCAARVWPDAPSKGNSALRYWRGLDLDENLAYPPHRAGPDSYVTAALLADMLKSTPVKEMVRWMREPMFLATCPLGKHRGAAWPDVPHDYLQWISRTADLGEDVRHAANLELQRRRDAA